MTKFVEAQKDIGLGNYKVTKHNDIYLHSLFDFLNNEVYYESPFNEWKDILISDKIEDGYLGESLVGLTKINDQIYVTGLLETKEEIYGYGTTIEKMKEIINRWIDIARTGWQLPDGTKINLPDEILITEEKGKVIISRTDGFDPDNTTKGKPIPYARLRNWPEFL